MINSYSGVSGKIRLDNNGDRIQQYEFWTIVKNQDSNNYEWKKLYASRQ